MLKRSRNPSTKLRGLPGCYKIKLRTLGYRLVYQVNDKELLVLVIAIGKREYSAVYEDATKRLDE
ncbi:stability protein StbE [Escherichia albertii]|nr:stability protein StbE [Escherichia albertii]